MDYQAKLIRKREAERHIQQLTHQHKEKYDGDTGGLRMVRIDANTLVFSKEFSLSDEQIIENWLKKHKLYTPKYL